MDVGGVSWYGGAGVRCAVSCGRVAVWCVWCGVVWCVVLPACGVVAVASVVVCVWCYLAYPSNKTCNAKTSYKCAILLLACKSFYGP